MLSFLADFPIFGRSKVCFCGGSGETGLKMVKSWAEMLCRRFGGQVLRHKLHVLWDRLAGGKVTKMGGKHKVESKMLEKWIERKGKG